MIWVYGVTKKRLFRSVLVLLFLTILISYSSAVPTYWEVVSKTLTGIVYGTWRDGPSGYGPATLSFNDSTFVDRSVTNTISGSYPGLASIQNSLNITIGVSNAPNISYSLQIPADKHEQILYRPCYNVYKIAEQQFFKGLPYGPTATSTVDAFNRWNYNFQYI